MDIRNKMLPLALLLLASNSAFGMSWITKPFTYAYSTVYSAITVGIYHLRPATAAELRSKLGEVRAELTGESEAVNNELKGGLAEVRTELKRGLAEVNQFRTEKAVQIDAALGTLNASAAQNETLIQQMSGKIHTLEETAIRISTDNKEIATTISEADAILADTNQKLGAINTQLGTFATSIQTFQEQENAHATLLREAHQTSGQHLHRIEGLLTRYKKLIPLLQQSSHITVNYQGRAQSIQADAASSTAKMGLKALVPQAETSMSSMEDID